MSNKSEQLKEAIKTSIYRHLDNIEYEERSNDSVIDAIEDGINEAIDTVVKELEKPLPTDEEIVKEANEIGEKESWPIGRQTGFVFGAKWMRDLIQERSKK